MVSLREFSSQVGRDPALILRLIKRGIIPRNDNGTIPLAEGLAAFHAYNDAPKNRGGRPKKGTVKVEHEPPKKQEVKPKTAKPKKQEHTPLDVLDAEKEKRTEEAVSLNTAMRKAKLAQTTFQARLRELEYKLKSGELVETAAVAAEAQWLAEQVKAKLLAIPPRISSLCEGRIAREIEEIITDAINGALAELQKCKYKNEDQ